MDIQLALKDGEIPASFKKLFKDEDELKGLLHDLFSELQAGMSRYQILKFVLNPIEFPTPESVWHQCLRELIGRFDSLASLESELRKLDITQEIHRVRAQKLRRRAAKGTDPLEKKELELRAELEEQKALQAERRKPFVMRQIKDTAYEAKAFVDAYREAKEAKVFEHYEDSEPYNWYARVLMRRKYEPGTGFPPYIEQEKAQLEQLSYRAKTLAEILEQALEASGQYSTEVSHLKEGEHVKRLGYRCRSNVKKFPLEHSH